MQLMVVAASLGNKRQGKRHLSEIKDVMSQTVVRSEKRVFMWPATLLHACRSQTTALGQFRKSGRSLTLALTTSSKTRLQLKTMCLVEERSSISRQRSESAIQVSFKLGRGPGPLVADSVNTHSVIWT